METDTILSPDTLRAYLGEPAFRKQYGSLPDSVFQKVMRYGNPVGSFIECHHKIPRCMDRIKEMIREREAKGRILPSGTVVLGYELLNGSGRFDRFWHAPQGGLWLAVAWADTLLPEYARLLPLAAGTACCEAIRGYGVDAAIKWVNDIHVSGKKIGGILCETCVLQSTGERYHLIGIGINCNVRDFPAELRNTAASMHEIINRQVDLNLFAIRLLACLVMHFGFVHLQEEIDLENGEDGRPDSAKSSLVIDSWRKLSDTIGRRVCYGYDVVRHPLYCAEVVDIDRSGGLVMRLDDNSTVTESSGEIVYLD